jgi:hypothetical protein
MGKLEVFPQETLEQIFEEMLPSGESYEFDGGRLKASSASAISPLGLLLANRQSYWLALRLWLKKNNFKLIAETTGPENLLCVSNNYEVPKGSMEASIEWIANMAEITLIINATLDVRGVTGGRFQNFFDMVKLLRNHDLFVTLKGIFPIHNTSKGANAKNSKAIAIDIKFPNGRISPHSISNFADTHLRMLDLGHMARRYGCPLHLVESYFNEILERSDPILEALSSPAGYMAVCELGEAELQGRQWLVGPRDLLYEAAPDAAFSIFTVNKGEQPTTSTISRKWARTVCTRIEEWCLDLKDQLGAFYSLRRAMRNSTIDHAAPPYLLHNRSLFGHYGDEFRIRTPRIKKQRLARHILRCETELYRVEAHYAAMLPYTFLAIHFLR